MADVNSVRGRRQSLVDALFSDVQLDDGKLSESELERVLERCGSNHAPHITRLFQFLNASKTGSVDFDDFSAAVRLLDQPSDHSPLRSPQQSPDSNSFDSSPAMVLALDSGGDDGNVETQNLKLGTDSSVLEDSVTGQQVASLKEQLRGKASTIANLHSRQTALIAELKRLEDDNDSLRDQTHSLQQSLDRALASLRTSKLQQHQVEQELKTLSLAKEQLSSTLSAVLEDKKSLQQHVHTLEDGEDALNEKLLEVRATVDRLRAVRSRDLRLRLFWLKKRAGLMQFHRRRAQDVRRRMDDMLRLEEECAELRAAVADMERVDKEQKLMLEDLAQQFDATRRSPLTVTTTRHQSTLSTQMLTAMSTPSPRNTNLHRASASVESFRTYRLDTASPFRRAASCMLTPSHSAGSITITNSDKEPLSLSRETELNVPASPSSVRENEDRSEPLERRPQVASHLPSMDSDQGQGGHADGQEDAKKLEAAATPLHGEHEADGQEADGGGGGEESAQHHIVTSPTTETMLVSAKRTPSSYSDLKRRVLESSRTRLDFGSAEDLSEALSPGADQDQFEDDVPFLELGARADVATEEETTSPAAVIQSTMHSTPQPDAVGMAQIVVVENCQRVHRCGFVMSVLLWLHIAAAGASRRLCEVSLKETTPCCDYSTAKDQSPAALVWWKRCLYALRDAASFLFWLLLLPLSLSVRLTRFWWRGGNWIGVHEPLALLMSAQMLIFRLTVLLPARAMANTVSFLLPYRTKTAGSHVSLRLWLQRVVFIAIIPLVPLAAIVSTVCAELLELCGGTEARTTRANRERKAMVDKQCEDALRMHDQALTLSRATMGERHPDVGDTLYRMGMLTAIKGDQGRSQQLFEEALAVFRACGDGCSGKIQMTEQQIYHLQQGPAILTQQI